ncbi:SGNH/GDSL hydrolase family protein [Enterococcus sp.]|uniref:SGNH/GDSL hydrolase family protein n=1 Tax=Enterococcus sp. TaxID=35783 RepID=UPI0025BFEEC2|nr:SGNH/GDSL hydrolase family protein [Enterococcus sp.]
MELDQFRDVDLVIDRANDSFVQKQFVSQGDYKGRTLTVQVTNNGVINEVPGLAVNLRWQNQASGLTDLTAFSVVDKENNVFRLEYPEHMMTPGKVIASIQVIQNGKVTNLKEFQLSVQRLAGEAVGIVGKAEFSALVAVLSDANKFRTDIATLDASKAEKDEVNRLISNIGSGVPKETFASIADLQAKYPNGADHVMLVLDSDGKGYVYSWNGTEWVKGVLYQAAGIANGTVDYSKLADDLDYMKLALITENKYMQSVAGDGTITYTDTANYFLATFEVPEKGKLTIKKSALQHGQAIANIDSDGKAISYWSFDFGNMFNAAWANDYTSYYVIDAPLLKKAYPAIKKIVIEFRIEDRESAYIYGSQTADVTDKTWSSAPEFNTLRSIPNRIAERYDLLNEKTSVMYPNQSIIRFTVSTGLPEFASVSNRTSYFFKVPEKGTLEFPVYDLSDQQFLLVADSEGKVIQNYDYTYNTGTNIVSFLSRSSDVFRIDMKELRNKHLHAASIYLVVWNKAVDGFYVSAINAFDVSDVFPAIAKSETEDESDVRELVVVSEYPIVANHTGYLYLDNIDLYGNYYKEQDLFISQTDDNELIAGGFPIKMNSSDIQVPISRMANGQTKEQTSILCKTIPENAGDGKTVNIMMIGESTTEMAGYLRAIKSKFEGDTLQVNFVGSRGTEVKHEGRSGWTTNHFVNAQTYNGITNSFYNPETKKFDYAYYRNQNPSVPIPDIVFFNFGINDANQNIHSSETITNLYFMLGQIRTENPNVKFGIGLTSNLCRIENVAYRTESRRNNILKTIKALIGEFDKRQEEGYFLNPMFLAVDPIWDMRYEERQLSIYQTKTELFCTDGTHPADNTGYQKTADTTYFTVKRMFV